MKYSLKFSIRLFILWVIFFNIQRVLFIIHYKNDIDVSFGELIQLPWHGLRMDISSFFYAMGIPLVLLAILILFKNSIRKYFLIVIHSIIWVFTLIFSIIFSSELVSYHEWRTKLSSKIFIHFETPSEVFRTSSGSYTAWFILYLIIQLIVFYILYRYFILRLKNEEEQVPWLKKGLTFLAFLIGISFSAGIGFRGGLQEIPISATNAYYSKSQIVNDLSVNSVWNFIHMTFQHFKKDVEGMFTKLNKNEAKQITNELYRYQKNDSIRVLSQTNPDIIFITLESWAANMIGALGNPDHVTPYFDELTKEGLLFTNIYATSGTSETGHTSIFSGYPTIPGISISSESAKCRQLPSIFTTLKHHGYESSYYFGGALAYGNIGGYLTEMKVDRLTDENDLNLTPKGDLGIHDEAMFTYFIKELKQAKSPYLYGLFTQSTHSPYDMPMGELKTHPKNKEGYVNSVVYTDYQLKLLVEQLKLLPNFENTLVVFVADHGKTNYTNNNVYSSDFYHIPLLFWGGALKQEFKGAKNYKIGSQSDIAKTLLNQMEKKHDDFKWSKNLLDPNAPSWALLTSTMSFGIIDSTGYAAYHTINESNFQSSYKTDANTKQSIKTSRALVETIYDEYRGL